MTGARMFCLRGAGVAALVALALAGFALAATLRPSISHISLNTVAGSGRTMTVSGTGLNRLIAIRLGQRPLQITVVSPSEVTAAVPRGAPALSVSFAFRGITHVWRRCKGCSSDDWSQTR